MQTANCQVLVQTMRETYGGSLSELQVLEIGDWEASGYRKLWHGTSREWVGTLELRQMCFIGAL